jgi:hypothetical protein
LTVIDPLVPVLGIALAFASAALTPLIVTGMLVAAVDPAIVNVATATVPLLIAVVFSPKTTQVIGEPVEQETLFPAAVATVPAATVTPEMSAG